MKYDYKTLRLLDLIFLSIFFLGGILLMFYKYLLNAKPHPLIFYITVTASGLFVLIYIIIYYLMPLKKLDLNYFRNIIIGIIGGIAVWILSSTTYAAFKEDFWLSLNNLIIKVGMAIFIILIGYIVCKKKK